MDLAEHITPPDPAWRTEARRIWDQREDLRAAYPDPEDVGFRKWSVTAGTLEYPDTLGGPFPPVPPEELRKTGSGGPLAGRHLLTGVDDFELLGQLTDVFGPAPIGELGSVLDFGCGCGRVARWFSTAAANVAYHGCDVRDRSIAWCRANLRGRFEVNGLAPPLPFADASMDLVFALSLFSHFSRESSVAWLRELARVCKPDGRMIVTTHGAFATWVLTRSVSHQRFFKLSADDARELMRTLPERQFVFHPLQLEEPTEGGRPGDDYGHAFVTHEFVDAAWAPHAEVVAFVPAVHMLFQDAYVLRPRS